MSMKVELIRIQNALNISRTFESWFSVVGILMVLSIAPRNTFKRKILEAYFIKVMVPSLNSQMNNDVLTLFRTGIT